MDPSPDVEVTLPPHRHEYVNRYDGLLAFGMDRATDEGTVWALLQKLSDDEVMGILLPRLTDTDLENLYGQVYSLLTAHLSNEEYHRVFLKESGTSASA
jgi:hypothetical protein